jgi:hypothetical protein
VTPRCRASGTGQRSAAARGMALASAYSPCLSALYLPDRRLRPQCHRGTPAVADGHESATPTRSPEGNPCMAPTPSERYTQKVRLITYTLPGGWQVRAARPDDWWFHVRGMPGSHVILQGPPGTDPDRQTLQRGVHTRFVQKLSLTYYTQKDAISSRTVSTEKLHCLSGHCDAPHDKTAGEVPRACTGRASTVRPASKRAWRRAGSA